MNDGRWGTCAHWVLLPLPVVAGGEGGGRQVSTCHPVHPSVAVLDRDLLTSCRASSWVSAAAGNFWVFWTGSGSASLLDMCTASGGGPFRTTQLFLALLPCQALLHWAQLWFQPCFHVKLSYIGDVNLYGMQEGSAWKQGLKKARLS